MCTCQDKPKAYIYLCCNQDNNKLRAVDQDVIVIVNTRAVDWILLTESRMYKRKYKKIGEKNIQYTTIDEWFDVTFVLKTP